MPGGFSGRCAAAYCGGVEPVLSLPELELDDLA
jgi:hypothetical protein